MALDLETIRTEMLGYLEAKEFRCLSRLFQTARLLALCVLGR